MSDAGTRLEEFSLGLAALDDVPLERHPDALEAVHRALVGELDGLAGAGSPERPGG